MNLLTFHKKIQCGREISSRIPRTKEPRKQEATKGKQLQEPRVPREGLTC